MLGRHSRQPVDPAIEAVGSAVLNAAFRVHSALGPSMRETVHGRCLAHTLRRAGHVVELDRVLDLEFEGLSLPRALQPDMVVDGVVIVELKASTAPSEIHEAQLLSYLEHTGLTLGYVLNFRRAHMRDGIRRYVNCAEVELPSP